MRKRLATVTVACGAALVLAGTAMSFSVVHPVTGECRQILVPGPATFPGNREAVSKSALGPVICP